VIEKLIKKIGKCLDKEKIPYMIIGGQAVLIYGRPRLTRDVDITLGVDTDKFALIKGVCGKLGLRMQPKNPEIFAGQTRVLPSEEPKSKIRVDFIFSFTPYESQAISRARKVSVSGYPVKFASCEDVIIHKMVAGRAVDEEDVKSILVKNKSSLDRKYIRQWLSQFSKISEHRRMLERFNSLLRTI
jgi:predicted nucleotidyltransferase